MNLVVKLLKTSFLQTVQPLVNNQMFLINYHLSDYKRYVAAKRGPKQQKDQGLSAADNVVALTSTTNLTCILALQQLENDVATKGQQLFEKDQMILEKEA